MTIAAKPKTALLIVGHGSTENPDSSDPYFEHADEIRSRGIFSEVHCCFWKEEASMREACYMIDADEIYIVPDFISEGYFTQDVIPRELQLTGPSTLVCGKLFHYCLPVGIHPSMTGLLLRRAREVAPILDPAETTLIITGHGTSLNPNSSRAIRDQVALIAKSGAGYAKILAAYMEEPPFIADWHQLTSSPHVIVVPFFISDGLHSYQDIPVLLGIDHEIGAAASQRAIFRNNPHILHGKSLYYTSSIGTERMLADLVLDQVADFDATHKRFSNNLTPQSNHECNPETIAKSMGKLLQTGTCTMGELVVQADLGGFAYVLCHWLDAGQSAAPAFGGLDVHVGPSAARRLSTFAADGRYRFIKGRFDLMRGWLMGLSSDEDLRLALDHFYPAAAGLFLAHQSDALEIEHLRDKLERQTGIYRIARDISDATAQLIVREFCGSGHPCAKQILWKIDSNTPIEYHPPCGSNAMPAALAESNIMPLLCREACNPFVAECCKAAKKEAGLNVDASQIQPPTTP